MWIFVITWIMHQWANKKFNEYAYDILTGSSLYAYVSHYFYVVLIAVMIIRPYKIGFLPALAIVMLLTNGVIIITYIIFDFFWCLIFPKKKKSEGSPAGGDEAER